MPDDNLQLVQRFADMMNTKDLSLLEAFTAPDLINHNRAVADGLEASRVFWAAAFVAFPDLTATVEDAIASDDRVVGRYSYTATHSEDFLGIAASHRTVHFSSIDIWRVENGMLVEHWDEADLSDIAVQAGLAAAEQQTAATV